MNSNYLAQHLMNEGRLDKSQIRDLLRDIRGKDVQLPLRALKMNMISGDKLMSLDTDYFESEETWLTEDQLRMLKTQLPGETMRFAQALIDEKVMNFSQLEELLNKYDDDTLRPVETAVRRACGDDLPLEASLYADYMRLFTDSLIDFLHTPVIIDPVPYILPEDIGLVYEVSQRIGGDISLVGGMLAREEEFIRVAARYSGEDLTDINELTIDSMEEFFNVINGLFCIQLAGQNKETELDLPRHGKNIRPRGSQQLLLHILADFGTFIAVLSADEFF